jgi:protein phosphatase
MTEGAEVRPLTPEAGDRLVMGSDGLTNFLTEDDLREGVVRYPHPQEWADHMVETALQRGSKDNVTCIVVAFNAE